MTTNIEARFTKAQLATILSALDDQPRNPASKIAALTAIGRSAERFHLTVEEVLSAADGLLDGRMSAADFRLELQDNEVSDAESSKIADGSEDMEIAEAEAEAPDDEPEAATVAEPEQAAETEDAATAETDDTAESAQPKAPRYGTKQATMIEMMSRPEGATVDQLAAATGWQHHTVRGAIAGALKKKLKLTITTEKVRSVPPNRQGAKGSYTIYRIVKAA